MKQVMRKIGLSFIAGTIAVCSWAQEPQSNAREVSVTINKETKTAFQGDYKVSKNLMKSTLEDRLKKAGLGKPSKSKGYSVYKGVVFPELSSNKMDIYTKVGGKGSNASVILLVSTGYNNFISTATDAGTAANSITFLNKLNEDARAMQAAIDLAAQQKAAQEAEEKVKKTEAEKERLAKKKAKLEKEMEEAEKDKAKASQSAESERMKLENIKGKSGN